MSKNVRHGLGGFNQSGTYRSWYTMHQRCKNPKNASYRYYGERGIKVCERWNVLLNFIDDMGHRPEGMSLDRLDPNGDYSPENCRWLGYLDQQRTKGNVKGSIEIAKRIRAGEFSHMTHKQIGELFGFDPSAVSRIKSGEIWTDA